MKKLVIKTMVTSAVLIGLILAVFFLIPKGRNAGEQSKELDLVTDSLNKQNINDAGSRHLAIGKKDGIIAFPKKSMKEIYDVKCSKDTEEKLDQYKRRGHYSFESPLLIWNPFGTNKLSLYCYFRDEENTYITYTIQVDDSHIPAFTRTLNNHKEGNLTRVHEYQLTGFVPGYQNYVVLRKYNEKGKLIQKSYFDFYVDKLKEPVRTKLSYEDGKSEKIISEGLYCISGYQSGDKNAHRCIPLYDNSGVIRSVIPIKNYRTDRLEIVDDSLIYSCSDNSFAKVSSLGKVEKVYPLGQYRLYHDFIYNGYGQLWCLVSDAKSNTVGDKVISVLLKDGKVTKIVDFAALFRKEKEQAEKKDRTRPLNWIDLNSLDRVDSSDIVVSSSALSSIIRINHVTSGYPKVGYIISEREFWKKSNNKKYLLLKGAYVGEKWYNLSGNTKEQEEGVHNFSNQFGQNSIAYEPGSRLGEGQYYLTMLNNNYAYAKAVPYVNWKKFRSAGTKGKSADSSYYYKYLVDEKAGYYGLEQSYKVPCTQQGGAAFKNERNCIINSMDQKLFGEYDNEGKLIREFTLKAYRVSKNTMKNVWYY